MSSPPTARCTRRCSAGSRRRAPEWNALGSTGVWWYNRPARAAEIQGELQGAIEGDAPWNRGGVDRALGGGAGRGTGPGGSEQESAGARPAQRDAERRSGAVAGLRIRARESEEREQARAGRLLHGLVRLVQGH